MSAAESTVTRPHTSTPDLSSIGHIAGHITTVARTIVVAAALGGALLGDAYLVAFALPWIGYELLVGAVLAAVVVPMLRRDQTDETAHAILSLTTVVLAVATVVAVLAAPLITLLVTNSGTSTTGQILVTTLAYLMLPAMFCHGVAAILGAVLASRGQRRVVAWAPVVANLGIIVASVAFMQMTEPGRLDPTTISTGQVVVLGLGTTAGILCQAIVLVPALRRAGFRWKWRLEIPAGFTTALRSARWTILALSAVPIGVLPMLWISRYASDRGEPGPLTLYCGLAVMLAIQGVVPRPRPDHLAADIRRALPALIPTTVAAVVLGTPLAIALFGWGRFSTDQATAVGSAISIACLALIPLSLAAFQIRALGERKSAAIVAWIAVGVMVVVDIGVLLWTPTDEIMVGLLWGVLAASVIAMVGSAVALHRNGVALEVQRLVQTATRLLLVSFFAGGICWAISFGVRTWLGTDRQGAWTTVLAAGTAFVLAFGAGAIFLRIREIPFVARRRRQGRSQQPSALSK